MLRVAFGRFKGKSKPQFSSKKGSTHTLNPDDFGFQLTTFEKCIFNQEPKTPLINLFPRRIPLISIASFPREQGRGENPRKHTFSLSLSYRCDDSLPKSESRATKERNFSSLSCLFIIRSLASRDKSTFSHTGRVTPVVWEETSSITISEASVHKWGSCHFGEILWSCVEDNKVL